MFLSHGYHWNALHLLQRGKFRPALPGLVAANKPEDVEKTSRSALQKLPNVEAATRGLSVLRGIGPATASGVCEANNFVL